MFLFLFYILYDLIFLKDLFKGFVSVELVVKELIFELFIFVVFDLNKEKKRK